MKKKPEHHAIFRPKASSGIEPLHKGFADPSLTTWVRRRNHYNKKYRSMSTQFFHAIFASLIDCGNFHFRNKPQFLNLSDNLLCRSQHQVSVSQNRPHGAVFIRYFDRRFANDAVEVDQCRRIVVVIFSDRKMTGAERFFVFEHVSRNDGGGIQADAELSDIARISAIHAPFPFGQLSFLFHRKRFRFRIGDRFFQTRGFFSALYVVAGLSVSQLKLSDEAQEILDMNGAATGGN